MLKTIVNDTFTLQLLGVRHATLGIRRENKGHWERRVPLTPDNVRVLVDQVCCALGSHHLR